jgi:hypothetical protein
MQVRARTQHNNGTTACAVLYAARALAALSAERRRFMCRLARPHADAMQGSLPARTAHAAARRDAANRARVADASECPSAREHALVGRLLTAGPRALLRRYPRLFLYEWVDVWTSPGSRRRGDLVLASPAARSLLVVELKYLAHAGCDGPVSNAAADVARERVAARRAHVAEQARDMARRLQRMFPRARVRAATCVNDADGKLALEAVDFF